MILHAGRHVLSLVLLAVLLLSAQACDRFSATRTSTGKITQILEGIVTPHHYGDMALSPDGKTLALPEWKRGVDLWELTAGKSRLLPNTRRDEVGGGYVAFSKDGRSLAASHGHGITIWAITDGTESMRIPHEGGVGNMVFTDADRTLLAENLVRSGANPGPLDYKSVIIRWNVSSGKRLSSVDFGAGQSFKAISSDGRYGVVDDFQAQSVGVYDLATRAKIFGLPRFGDFIFADGGSAIIYCEKNLLTITEIPSGKQLKRFDVAPPFRVGFSLALSVSSQAKVLAAGRYPADHLMSLISLESGKVLGTVECGPPMTICRQLLLSADGRTLVTGTHGWSSKDQPVMPMLKIWRLPETW